MNKYQKRINYVLNNSNYNRKKAKEIAYDDKRYDEFVCKIKKINEVSMKVLKMIMPHWIKK